MASEEKKAQDRKMAEEALFNARGAGSAQAETDMFMCGKCKGRKTTYFHPLQFTQYFILDANSISG
jgi:transcription elongation factor S-II